MSKPNWHRFDSSEEVAQAACQNILDLAHEAIQTQGQFKLVLAGGTTPEQCYRLLAKAEADWSHWHIYFGDERCLPPENPERNSRMAQQALTGQVPIPPSQVHPIPAELGPKAGAAAYGKTISNALPFDLVLLGMGEDGHTASLFPGHQHPTDSSVVAVHEAPKPPPERISLNRPALENCKQLLMLITGAGKREAITAWRADQRLPINSLQPKGHWEVYCDSEAWVDF